MSKLGEKQIFVPNEPYKHDGHYVMVEECVNRLGTPRVVAVKRGNEYYCLEGSHRIYYFYKKGMKPWLVIVDEDHEYYTDFENNYKVSAKNAPSWVISDLPKQTAKATIETLTANGMTEYRFNDVLEIRI